MPIGIHQPKSRTKSTDREEYLRGFRRKVFTLIRMGYNRLDSAKYKNSEEPDITGELVKKMREVTQDCSAPKWVAHFSIHDDPPVNASDRFGKDRRRLDIEIERTCYGPHPRYPFEAKRLSENNFTVGKYLGQTGLGEFISGNYAFNENEAGMLGYVQSENPEEWASKILSGFKKNKTSMQICSDGEWTHVEVTSDLDHCYHSEHKRHSIAKPITIYHLLLDFC